MDQLLETRSLMGTRYRKVRVLGNGSFGQAFLAYDSIAREHCVVKRLKSKVHDRELRQALNEVKNLSKVRHPNIVEFREAWTDEDGHLYICMEYCVDGDAEQYLKDHFPLDPKRLQWWVVQLLLALDSMHSRRVIHRDMKLANVFLAHDGWVVKVGDFGLSKLLQATDEASKTQAGTPFYFSPEIATAKPHNRKTDMWSLGVVLYKLLTNVMPFEGRCLVDILTAIMCAPVITPLEKFLTVHPNRSASAVPECLSDLAVKLLTRDPMHRPSAKEVLDVGWAADLAATRPWEMSVRQALAGVRVLALTTPGVAINVRKSTDFASDVVGRLKEGDVIHVTGEERQQITVPPNVNLSKTPGAPPPTSILWFQLQWPVEGFCIAELNGQQIFDAAPSYVGGNRKLLPDQLGPRPQSSSRQHHVGSSIRNSVAGLNHTRLRNSNPPSVRSVAPQQPPTPVRQECHGSPVRRSSPFCSPTGHARPQPVRPQREVRCSPVLRQSPVHHRTPTPLRHVHNGGNHNHDAAVHQRKEATAATKEVTRQTPQQSPRQVTSPVSRKATRNIGPAWRG